VELSPSPSAITISSLNSIFNVEYHTFSDLIKPLYRPIYRISVPQKYAPRFRQWEKQSCRNFRTEKDPVPISAHADHASDAEKLGGSWPAPVLKSISDCDAFFSGTWPGHWHAEKSGMRQEGHGKVNFSAFVKAGRWREGGGKVLPACWTGLFSAEIDLVPDL
jgi:hypothetical protein